MTSRDHESGTDRLAEVVQDLGLEEQDWVLNLQGDEPLLNPAHLDHLIASIELDLSGGKKASSESAIPVGMGSSSMNLFSMGTLVTELTEEGFFDPNTVKAILDDQSFALYFTRAQAPYTRKKFEVNRPSLSGGGSSRASGVYKHLGVYAYEVSFLRQFAMWPKHLLEEAEGLEQLRALAHGHKIKCVWVEQPVYEFAGRKGFFSTSVDTQEDLERVRAIVETHQLWP
jgi:3-deoxy-manno-octulosonate cytidylyltransferase (CMP-KDO synthetase)